MCVVWIDASQQEDTLYGLQEGGNSKEETESVWNVGDTGNQDDFAQALNGDDLMRL